MTQQYLQITAILNTGIATFNKWSPCLDGLLAFLILEKEQILDPNPTQDQVDKSQKVLTELMPISKGFIGNEWYWKVSSPVFSQGAQYRDRYRKRWDYQEYNLNWGKRKAKWQSSEGGEKNYDLPLECQAIKAISWFAVGDKQSVEELLVYCTHIGKKRSYGNGEVHQWQITEIPEDFHLVREGALMRPIPYRLAGDLGLNASNNPLMDWGWRPPAWLSTNQELCLMP